MVAAAEDTTIVAAVEEDMEAEVEDTEAEVDTIAEAEEDTEAEVEDTKTVDVEAEEDMVEDTMVVS